MATDTIKKGNSKTCILIIGMHRTGTSFLSRFLNYSGIDAGSDLMGPSFDNPYGFFEHNKVVSLNDKILNDLGCKWDNLFIHKDIFNEEDLISTITDLLKQLIETEFSKSNLFFIKDPRLSLLLPLWIKALNKLSISIRIIICNRPPGEVVQSLAIRNNFSANKSNLLYIHYMLSAEIHSRTCKRLILRFNSHFTDYDTWVSSISNFLSNEIESEISSNTLRSLYDNNIKSEFDFSLKNHGKLKLVADSVYHCFDNNSADSIELKKCLIPITEDFQNLEGILFELLNLRHFGKILFYSNGTKPSKTINFQVTPGLNSISLDVKNEDLTKIVLFPIHAQSIIDIHKITIDNKEIKWKNTSGVVHENLIYFDVEFPTLDLMHVGSTNQITLSYFIDHIGEDIKRFIEFFSLKHELKELKSEYSDFRRNQIDYTENLNSQIELLNLLSETEKQEDYGAYKRSLLKLKDSIAHSSSTYDKTLLEITTSINEISEKHKEEISDLNSKYQSEIAILTSDLEQANLKHYELQSNHKIQIDKYIEDIKSSNHEFDIIKNQLNNIQDELNQLQVEKENNRITIDRQHGEIVHIKRAYSYRENELIDVEASLSYKLGRMITYPLRVIYEGSKPVFSFFYLLTKLLIFFITNPAKFVRALSPQNLKTFFTAINNESASQILRNAKNYLGLPSNLSNTPKRHHIQSVNIKKKSVLFISPNLPDYDSSAGGRRATYMIKLLCENFDVYVFTLGTRPDKYSSKLESVGAIVIHSSHHKDLYKKAPHIDSIIFGWYYTLHDNSAILNYYQTAQIIVDTVDIHWIRETRSIGQISGITETTVERNKKIELESYQRADIIWTVSEEDKMAVLKELPNARINIVSIIYDIEVKKYEDPKSNNILFLGGYNHPPNLIAVKILTEEIFPEVSKKRKYAKLIIAGANAPDSIKKYKDYDGVEFIGFVPTEEMKDLYKRTLMCVAPLTVGAGVKGKICEAIAYGVPVVTTDIGNEGIGLVHEEEGFVTRKEEMSHYIIKIIDRFYDLEAITSRAQAKLLSLMGSNIAKQRMLDSINQEITICIVTWNRLELLKRCLESIFSCTIYPYYKIFVHSNGCTDGTRSYLQELAKIEPRIIPILSETNDVFVLPNNWMMKKDPHNDVVLLNNDTYVTKGWLQNLRTAAYQSPKIGIVGSKILYPDGTLQEFGSELYESGTGKNIGKWDNPEKEEYQNIRYTGYVSGCSMYIKRATINTIGYFDEQFHPCYCEDSDYAYTAWKHNIRTIVTPESIVYHDEGGTSGTDENSGYKTFQKLNFKKFLKKHKDFLPEINKTINSYNG